MIMIVMMSNEINMRGRAVPVSSSSSRQYITSGSFPFALAAAMAAGGMVMRGTEYMAPVGCGHGVESRGACETDVKEDRNDVAHAK